jgi:hypothetical protein
VPVLVALVVVVVVLVTCHAATVAAPCAQRIQSCV